VAHHAFAFSFTYPFFPLPVSIEQRKRG
jgi:hypothetical protein